VLTVPEMDWIVPALEQWVDEVRALFSPGNHPALWMTERRWSAVAAHHRRSIRDRPRRRRPADELDLHCLRHSYVTHLLGSAYPERFVKIKLGMRTRRRPPFTVECPTSTATGCRPCSRSPDLDLFEATS